MAADNVLEHALPVLLEAAQAACPAALELFWASEQQWQDLHDPSTQLQSYMSKLIALMQPAVEDMEQEIAQQLQLVDTKLAAAMVAPSNQPSLLPRQQHGAPGEAADDGVSRVCAESGKIMQASAQSSLWASGRDDDRALQCFLRMWGRSVSEMQQHQSRGAVETPFAREGKQLMAAVQQLKAKTKRLCEQRREAALS